MPTAKRLLGRRNVNGRLFLLFIGDEWARKTGVLAKVDSSREFKPAVFNIFEWKTHDVILLKYRVRQVPRVVILNPSEQPLRTLWFSGQTVKEWVAVAWQITLGTSQAARVYRG
ncbi:MAG: hypothetical protein M2R45_03743 [Verrucomicrobia subdivision 3 bacterium]|nr:hypothetical protein [Limisphaerales bacterium]MCS1416934.1 hypothetical protein [Limisphaerales bacterium]